MSEEFKNKLADLKNRATLAAEQQRTQAQIDAAAEEQRQKEHRIQDRKYENQLLEAMRRIGTPVLAEIAEQLGGEVMPTISDGEMVQRTVIQAWMRDTQGRTEVVRIKLGIPMMIVRDEERSSEPLSIEIDGLMDGQPLVAAMNGAIDALDVERTIKTIEKSVFNCVEEILHTPVDSTDRSRRART